MIPITRKEHYLNKIVGNDDYDIPEKPIIEEEFFFAEILGEAVQAPEPLPRYQIYLAKIAGKDVEIPYPETRLEYFLARAAGMDVETPVPITKEEIYWSNYTAIVEFELDGVPPLTYKAIEGTLTNYRIYGNTVDGESVGDRTGNLFDEVYTDIPEYNRDFIIYKYYYVGDGTFTLSSNITRHETVCNLFLLSGKVTSGASSINNGVWAGQSQTVQSIDGYITIAYRNNYNIDPRNYNTMLNEGSAPLPYEPYGYKVPVTVSYGTDTLTTSIYLPEQIRKVGDEAEYIDYGEQKLHRVRVNLSEVNEFSNSIADTSNRLSIWVQQGKGESFVYPASSNIFNITEPTTITTFITVTDDNDSIRIKHNGSKSDIVIDIVRGLSPGAYSVSFNVLNYDHTTVGGLVINNIMVNKGSTALPYEPYIENTDLDVTLPALPTLSGTNTLSVGTTVQPSKVYIKGEKRRD